MMAFEILKEIICEKRSPLEFYKGVLVSLQDLRNPEETLQLSTIKDAASKKQHFLVIGSLTKAYPLKKHEPSGSSIKVLILQGVLHNDTNSKIRVVLFNDCARDAELASLNTQDLLGFYEPSVILNCAAKHTEEPNLLEHQIIFGRQKKQSSLFFFMKKGQNFSIGNNNNDTSETSDSGNSSSSDTVGKEIHFKIFNERKEKIAIINVQYEYTRLIDAHNFATINLYAVVDNVLGRRSTCNSEKAYCMISITDDSVFPGVFIVAIYHDQDTVLSIHKNQILRFHRLHLEKVNGRLDGKVFNGWDVVSFDPSEIDRASGKINGVSCARRLAFTEDEYEQIFLLKEWMESAVLTDSHRIPNTTEENITESICQDPKAFEHHLQILDANVQSLSELSAIRCGTEFNLLCEVLCFRQLDNDHAALIVGDGESCCPLKLASFPFGLTNCETVDDCLKASVLKENCPQISMLLKNISKEPTCEDLQSGKQNIFISYCVTPKQGSKDKTNLVITCDLQMGNILILDPRLKSTFKDIMFNFNKPCKESAPNSNGPASVSTPDRNLSWEKSLASDEESPEEPVLSHSSCGPKNDEVVLVKNNWNSNLAKGNSSNECDPGQLTSAHLTTSLTKLMKLNECNGSINTGTNEPKIMESKTQHQSDFFDSKTSLIKEKKKVEKETGDINSLDEVLPSSSKGFSVMMPNNETSVITNGSSPSNNSINNFEPFISAAVITSPKSCKSLAGASKSSSDSDTDGSSALENHVSSKIKFKTSNHNQIETPRVSGSSKIKVTKTVTVQKKKLSTLVQSQCLLSSPKKSVPSSNMPKSAKDKLITGRSKKSSVRKVQVKPPVPRSSIKDSVESVKPVKPKEKSQKRKSTLKTDAPSARTKGKSKRARKGESNGKKQNTAENMGTNAVKTKKAAKTSSEDASKFTCVYCNKTFPKKYNFERHVETHMQQQKFLCQYCSKFFTQNSSLNRHMSLIHNKNANKFQCEECGKMFALKSHLDRHSELHKEGRETFLCEICDKYFNRLDNMLRHRKTHTKQMS